MTTRSWPQQQARRIHLEFLKDRWRPLALFVAILLGVVVVVVVAVPNRYAAFAAGAGVASLAWYVALIVVHVTGTTRYMLGHYGQEWTSEALRPLRRRGWQLKEGIPLGHRKGDVDHVLIGPAGIYAIETKAASGEWNVDQPDHWLHRAAAQARFVAQQTHNLLLAKPTQMRIEVEPLLVVWGAVAGTASHVDGVRVVHGPELVHWARGLPATGLAPDDVERASAGLQQFIEMRDEHIRRTEGRPPLLVEVGPLGILSQISTGIMGAFAVLPAIALPLAVLPEDAFVPLLALAVAMGGAAARTRRLRLLGIGWLAMSSSLAVLLAGLYVFSWLQN